MGWNISLPDAEWFTLNSPGLGNLINEVVARKDVAIDTETTGLKVVQDIPLYWSLSWGSRRMCMPASTLHKFSDAFKQRDKNWIFANAKFDMHMLAQVGIDIAGSCIDTSVMHALIYEEQPHGLKSMVKQVLTWGWKDFFDTFHPLNVLAEQKERDDEEPEEEIKVTLTPTGKIRKAKPKKLPMRKETIGEMLQRFEATELDKLVEYASNDAYGTYMLYVELKKRLEEEATWSLYPEKFANLWDVFYKTERPFTKVLYKCERNGLLIDTDYIASIKKPVEDGMAQIERDIVKITGRVLNIRSPDVLREYFFEEKGYTSTKLTKGGKNGTNKKAAIDADVLKELAVFDPVAKHLVEYRDLDKMYGTYIVGLSKHLSRHNRIHCRLNQDVARTGRLSSSNPNLQNIPKPESDKYKIRRAFIAGPGNGLIVVDYEQLEMRLLAAAAQEPDMIEIFRSGKDIHMGNAALVFGPIYKERYGRELTYQDLVDAKKVDKDVKNGKLPPTAMTDWVEKCLFARNAIKAVGFGLNYGMKPKKLGVDLGIPTEEAEFIYDAYMATYPTVKRFFDNSVLDCQQTLKAFTLLGRRRFLPEINAYNKYERYRAERQAGNTIIQGTAADAARMAMLNCDEAQLDYHYGAEMLIQIHDELIFECPLDTIKACEAEVKDWMEHPFDTELDVALTASSGTGSNWMDAK